MQRSVRFRLFVVVASMLLGALFVVPTVVPTPPDWLAPVLPDSGAKLGLDLRGGMHLVLEVDVDEAVYNRVIHLRNQLANWLSEESIAGSATVTGTTASAAVVVEVPNTDVDKLIAWLDDWTGVLDATEPQRGPDLLSRVVVSLNPQEAERIRDWAVLQSLETISNRIDQFGVSEPSIQRQGANRIVVQLPGIDDPERAKELVGQTAQLTFNLLREDIDSAALNQAVDDWLARNPEGERNVHELNAALAATLPAGVVVRFQRVADDVGSYTVPSLIDAEPLMTGDSIIDARVQIDTQFNEPYVMLEFSREGGERFEQITAANINRRMAIVLDDIIYSAPVIRERISGGRASIDGAFTIEQARDLAIVLRAGALPAPVRIEEERTVGPSLGADSIHRGVRAIVVGGLLVILFMIAYYRVGGVVADVSLVANLLFLLGILGMFGATLTLPGLAGIVLTIGMAVDGNVLIFERIREELRAGRSARVAVDAGFGKALWTILDANITTLIAGIILFQFGTGPVRGFAVTLTVGILTTLFSVLFVSRTLLDAYVMRRAGAKQLAI